MTLVFCVVTSYADNLPLRADWIPFLPKWHLFLIFALCVKLHCSNASYFSLLSTFQIFVGKIPRDLFEDELVPLFEKAGPIWDLRLMMDPFSGLNRGYAFVTFCTKEAAQQAVKLVG